MLSHEWRELEDVCKDIADLRERYAHARRSQNAGLLEGLKNQLALARRKRESLVQHISARLGSAATQPRDPSQPAQTAPTDGIGRRAKDNFFVGI